MVVSKVPGSTGREEIHLPFSGPYRKVSSSLTGTAVVSHNLPHPAR